MAIISSCLLLIVLTFIVLREYTIIQSYHYEFKRYLLHLKKSKGYYLFLYSLLALFIIKKDLIFIIISTVLLIFLVKKYALKYTNRVKRMMVINGVLLAVFFMLGVIKYVYVFSFFYLFFLHLLSSGVEKIVFLKYLKSARRKIKDKFIIGITGSGGKTSVKNMIYDVLINKYNVSKTPKSFNNRVGIVSGINNEIRNYDDFFICEYGVDKKGMMDKLIKIAKPKISVITTINKQHLLTFKTVDNIVREKLKLIECLDEDGVGIINNDNAYLRDYNYKDKSILRYGIEYEADVMARNIKIDCYHSEFDLYIKNTFIKRVSIPLLSRHGVENTLACVCVLIALKMDIEYIVNYIEKVKAISHRLEYKIIDNIEVIDDSFNSNEKGFRDAIEVLITSSKYKIVITPGIIEQGSNNKVVNSELAACLVGCDFVCLVSENSKYIKEKFDEFNFSNYRIFDSFFEAFKYSKSIEKEKIILIENDLPNIYLN